MPGIVNGRNRHELKRRVSRIKRLPSMPPVVQKLLDMLSGDQANAVRLGRVIQSDQALTSKVLNLANSAYYGFSNRIATVQHAVVAIGLQELQMLAVGSGLAGIFDPKQAAPSCDGTGMWLHCLAVSWATRELAKEAAYPEPGEMLVAGLLHDVGKLVMATHLQEEFTAISKLVSQGLPYYKAEEEVGIIHTQVGSWLAERWGLPQVHLAAIGNHHRLDPADPHIQSTALVVLADSMVKSLGLGLIDESPGVDAAMVIKATELSPQTIGNVTHHARTVLPSMLASWQAMLDSD